MSPDAFARVMRDPVQAAAYAEHLAESYRDLESGMNDLRAAALALIDFAESSLTGAREEVVGNSPRVYRLTEEQETVLWYLLYNALNGTRDVHSAYYAGFDACFKPAGGSGQVGRASS